MRENFTYGLMQGAVAEKPLLYSTGIDLLLEIGCQ